MSDRELGVLLLLRKSYRVAIDVDLIPRGGCVLVRSWHGFCMGGDDATD